MKQNGAVAASVRPTQEDNVEHTFNLCAVAQEMKAAQDEVRQIAPLTSHLRDFDEAVAYDVARVIHQVRLNEGAVAVGRKIGFTNPDMWSLYGVREPIWAYVYDTTVVYLAAPQATCRLGRFAEPKIEPEIVVHFRSAPPVTDDVAEILACVDWMAHGIEIVQSHFPGWQFQAADTIADCALHGTLLVGEPHDVRRLGADVTTALERFAVTLSCDGHVRAVGKGANVLGSPLAAIAHLLAVVAKQRPTMLLQANELVTTGTLTPALPIHAGETWRTDLHGIALSGVAVQFVA
jgi:2-keto-4-pentenoate hydratase